MWELPLLVSELVATVYVFPRSMSLIARPHATASGTYLNIIIMQTSRIVDAVHDL